MESRGGREMGSNGVQWDPKTGPMGSHGVQRGANGSNEVQWGHELMNELIISVAVIRITDLRVHKVA